MSQLARTRRRRGATRRGPGSAQRRGARPFDQAPTPANALHRALAQQTPVSTPDAATVLSLQKTLGNQHVQRMLHIQRAAQDVNVVGKGTKSFEWHERDDDEGNRVYYVKSGSEKDVPPGKQLAVDYDERALTGAQWRANKADTSGIEGPYAWAPGENRYVEIKGLHPQPSSPPPKARKTLGGIGKRTGEALSIGSDSSGLHNFKDQDKINDLTKEIKDLPDSDPNKAIKQAEKDQLSNDRTGVDLAGASLSGGTQLFVLVNSIQKLVNAKGGWKRAEAGMDLTTETVKIGASIATVIDKAGKDKYGASAGFGGQAAGAAQGIEKSTMASGVMTAIGEILAGVVAAVKRVKSIVQLARKKHKVGAKEKANEGMDTLKDSLSIAKAAVSATKSIVDVTESSGASDALKNAVPGLGIAISAVDMIQRAFKFVVDAMNKGRARGEKDDIKAALAAKLGVDPAQITKARILKYKAGGKIRGVVSYAKRSKETKQAIEDYLMAHELQYINRKRMTRQGIGIVQNINNIIADALTIGGVTSAAGLSLKIIGGASKLIIPAFRRFKQWGRDLAAKKIAAGEPVKGFLGAFNANKSTSAKDEQREKMINRMFQMLASWYTMPEKHKAQRAEKRAQEKRVKNFFKASGMSWTAVQTYEDAGELAKDLDKALKARE